MLVKIRRKGRPSGPEGRWGDAGRGHGATSRRWDPEHTPGALERGGRGREGREAAGLTRATRGWRLLRRGPRGHTGHSGVAPPGRRRGVARSAFGLSVENLDGNRPCCIISLPTFRLLKLDRCVKNLKPTHVRRVGLVNVFTVWLCVLQRRERGWRDGFLPGRNRVYRRRLKDSHPHSSCSPLRILSRGFRGSGWRAVPVPWPLTPSSRPGFILVESCLLCDSEVI